MSFRCWGALEATGRSTIKVAGILVTIKATVDVNVNSHCWHDFGSSENYSRQECQLPLLQDFGSPEKLRCQLR